MYLGANAQTINTFGAANGLTYFSRRAGNPLYVMLKEMTGQSWVGYEVATVGAGTLGYCAQGHYKPMKRVRYDDAAWTFKNLSDVTVAAAYPQNTSAIKSMSCDLSGKSTVATRIAAVIGYTASNCGIQIVTITDNVSGLPVVPNKLSTAAQLVATGNMASAALVSNGGTIPDAAYCLGTNVNDVIRFAANRFQTVPIYDGPAGSYTVKYEPTTVAGTGGGTVDRTYVAATLYGTAAMTHTDAGAELYRVGYISNAVDTSTNEIMTISGKKQGSGASRQLLGGGHGGEVDVSNAWTVDGATANFGAGLSTVSRTRASNVATLVWNGDTGCQVGDTITVTGVNSGAASSYCAEAVTVIGVTTTTVANDTITYANTGANEGVTADTAGKLFNHKVVVGSTVRLAQVSTMSHSTDGKLADKVTTLTLDSVKLAVRPIGTLVEAVDSDTQTYQTLATIWGGSRSSYGPSRGGEKRWRIYDTQTTKVLNAGDNSENLTGVANLGYVAWDAEGMWAAAVIIQGAPPVTGALVVQDRSPESGGVDKMYARYTAANAIIPNGTVISSGYDRYDTLRTSGDPMLVA